MKKDFLPTEVPRPQTANYDRSEADSTEHSQDKFLSIYKMARHLIPHQVVFTVVAGATPTAAWRTHLNLSQDDMAARLNISQPAYRKLENADRPKESDLRKMAEAFGIFFEQLDF